MSMTFELPDEGGSKVTVYKGTYSGRFVATGTFFCHGVNGKTTKETHTVRVPSNKDSGIYLIQVSLSMLSAPGGTFDEEDTVFADIFAIDNKSKKLPHLTWGWTEKKANRNIRFVPEIHGDGGAWGHHLGELGYSSGKYLFSTKQDLLNKGYDFHMGTNPSNMGTSSMVAQVSSSVKFRLSITGDDWAAANYLVLEL